ncbi:hypothetical protein QFZ55_008094 [Streptomyces luteogriseus]|nr:hypothetical protein [Streptomyces luteogriseus]
MSRVAKPPATDEGRGSADEGEEWLWPCPSASRKCDFPVPDGLTTPRFSHRPTHSSVRSAVCFGTGIEETAVGVVCCHCTSLWNAWRGPGAVGARAPKELLHHLPALVLRRPAVSADPTWMLSGVRGSRLLDRRPPHYRCPAVPGPKTSARAILMALGSSVLPSVFNHSLLSGLQQHHSSAASPVAVLRLLWLGTPLPNFPVRASAADAFTEVLLTDFTAVYCELPLRVMPLRQLRYCSRRPLITAGHPVRQSVPSPSCNIPGFATPPPGRPSHCNCVYCWPAVHLCQAPLISATGETVTRPPPQCLLQPT